MGKRRLTLKQLRRILRSFDVEEDASRGKGSHVMFWKSFPEGDVSYTVPRRNEVLPAYVKGCRRAFRLTPEEGVTDEQFFGRA